MTLRACLQANCIALIIMGLLKLSKSPTPDPVDVAEKGKKFCQKTQKLRGVP